VAANKKTIIGVIFTSLVASVAILVNHQEPINTKSNKLQALIIHCSATPAGRNLKAVELADWFTRPKAKGGKGWKKPGYNDVIELNGRIVNIVPYNEDSVITWNEIAYGAAEYNGIARNICYIGGCDKKMQPHNTLTSAQDTSLKNYIRAFIRGHPNAYIVGHNQLVNKACPSFDVPTKLRAWGIPEKNIYKPIKNTNEKVIRNFTDKHIVNSDI